MRTFIPSLLVLAACGTLTTYQSADPVARGHWQAMVAGGYGQYADHVQDTRTPTVPAELGARYGIADDVDVGAKLYALGGEASVRWRIASGTWSWALLAAAGGMQTGAWKDSIPPAWLGQLRVGAVATRHHGRAFSWSVGPTTTGSLWIPAGGGHASGVLLGGFGSCDWRFAERWHLIPELSLHRALTGDFPVDRSAIMLGTAFARDW